jgi:UDP:flavonoid glycosyltransferase YjiC (YdhE family)
MASLGPGVPFISQTLPEASLPVDHLPPNVISAGAILLDSAPAEEQDAELAAWILRAPTVVVNLGSLFKYTGAQARIMAQAIEEVLYQTDVQVLWKMAGSANFGTNYTRSLASYLEEGRVKIFEWLPIDTLPLLVVEKVIASVHHGGSSSFNEAMT